MDKKRVYFLAIIVILCFGFFIINYLSLTGFVGFNVQSYNNLSEAILANDCDAVENWDISQMTDFLELFKDTNNFNCDLTSWDVSNVNSIFELFYNSTDFSADLSNWEFKTKMNMPLEGLFRYSSNFSGNLSNWKSVGTYVPTATYLFADSTNFNGDLSNWNFTEWEINNLNNLFENTTNFSSNLNSLDMSFIESITSMFSESDQFKGNLSHWNLGRSSSLTSMFTNCFNFNGDLSNWNLSSLNSLGGIFDGTVINFSGDLSNWDLRNTYESAALFANINGNVSGNFSNWKLNNLMELEAAFAGTTNFNADISNWEMNQIQSMSYMIYGATNFSSDISNWNISSVTDLSNFAIELSTELYDKLLINWGSQELQRDVVWDLGNTNYTEGNPEIYKNRIITEYNWTINDGGMIEDVISPKINIISPIEGEDYSNNSIEINLDVYDVNLKEIYYNYNGLNKSYNQTITEIIGNGQYNLQIWAIDNYDNVNYSNIVFNVSKTELEEENENQHKRSTSISYIQNKYLEQGYINYYSEEESKFFNLSESTHKITIERIKDNNVTIKIESEPLIKELSIGEEWKVDFEMDNIYDLYIKVNSIRNNKAYILIKQINEDYSIKQINEDYSIKQINEIDTSIEEEYPQKERNNIYYYIIGVILLILILLILYLNKKHKRK